MSSFTALLGIPGRDMSVEHPETSAFMRGDSPYFMVNQYPKNQASASAVPYAFSARARAAVWCDMVLREHLDVAASLGATSPARSSSGETFRPGHSRELHPDDGRVS